MNRKKMVENGKSRGIFALKRLNGVAKCVDKWCRQMLNNVKRIKKILVVREEVLSLTNFSQSRFLILGLTEIPRREISKALVIARCKVNRTHAGQPCCLLQTAGCRQGIMST
jgi:hypothetical protein